MCFGSNVPEAVYLQNLMGVEGVIVDFAEKVTEAVSIMIKRPSTSTSKETEGETKLEGEEVESKSQFSERELSFLLKLIPELIQL